MFYMETHRNATHSHRGKEEARHPFLRARVVKVVMNVGVGRLSQQPHFEEKLLPEVMRKVSLIAGQKPAVTRAKKSIAGFKTRGGQVVGVRVTLRHRRMEDFLEKLIRATFPRVRDFRGIPPTNIDKSGNMTIGFRDHTVFPEINAELSKVDFGVEVSIVSNAKNRGEAIALYHRIGMPLRDA